MAREFNVASMEVMPKLDGHDDVVVIISALYGDTEASMPVEVPLDAPGSAFTPLSSVTPEVALQWLIAKVNEPTVIKERNDEGEIVDVPGPTLLDQFNETLDRVSNREKPYTYGWMPEEEDPA